MPGVTDFFTPANMGVYRISKQLFSFTYRAVFDWVQLLVFLNDEQYHVIL